MADSMRAALEAAFRKSDEAEVDPSAEPAEEVEIEAAPEVDEPAAHVEEPAAEEPAHEEPAKEKPGRDEKGRFGKKAEAAAAAEPAQKPVAKAAAAAEQGAQPEQQKPAGEPLKAPSSLKAAAREVFSQAPRVLQEDMIRIDREVRQVMQESAGARQFASQFKETIAPYVGMIRAEQRGRAFDPLEAISAVMDTAVALRTGHPAAKVKLLGEMIDTYGVPPDQLIAQVLKGYRGDLKQLDEAVTRLMEGHAPAAAPQRQQPQQEFRDPRLDRFLQERDQQDEARKREVFQQGKAEVDGFAAKAEFYEDVRADMARLIAVAHQGGEQMSLQEAYDTALALPKHKGIQGVLAQRAQAQAVVEKQKKAARARAAGSSVRGSPTGTAAPEPATNSRRAALESAMSDGDR